MPIVNFDSLPDASRVWVFGSDRALSGAEADRLLAEVDRFLGQWKAHGVPLECARDWRDEHLLTIGVDSTQEGASGCSIDGLFRVLQGLEQQLGATMVGGGRVFYRGEAGTVQSASRDEIPALVKSGAITKDTVVFDTSITDLGAFRAGFEKRAKESWIRELMPAEKS
jgi:hypothetical protein